ncbi:MAG: hypothetical protein ACOYEJ_06210 [Mahellales bacterium]|jgi:hypothetical protein
MFSKNRRKSRGILIFILVGILLLGSGYIYGYYFTNRSVLKDGQLPESNEIPSEKQLNTDYPSDNEMEGDGVYETDLDQRITRDTKIKFLHAYRKCGHDVVEESIVEEGLIGMNSQELEEYFDNWDVIYFSQQEVLLMQYFDGYCPKHYIIMNNNGYIGIYKNELGGEQPGLFKETSIPITVLPEDFKRQIQDGLVVDDEYHLDLLLEDIGS